MAKKHLERATIMFLPILLAVAVTRDPAGAQCLTETSAADFAGGVLSGTVVSEADSGSTAGQVRLSAPVNDLFLAPALDPLWNITQPSAGYTPVIAGGVLDVQERNDATYQTSAIESDATFTAGTTCEVRAIINPGSAFVNLGFLSSTAQPAQWVMFSTRGSGNTQVPVIKTSVRTASGTIDVPTTVTLGEWHTFKIVWTAANTVTFHVDGALVDTRANVNPTLAQHFGMYKSSGSASSLLIDWVRITPYSSSPGSFESVVLDAGTTGTVWTDLNWLGSAAGAASVDFETRTGSTPAPDGNWSAWSSLGGTAVTSPAGRYAQYRATLASSDLTSSPVIDEVQLCFIGPLDATPPTVATTTPPDGAPDIAVGAPVTATFSEAVDPATLTPASFTLTPPGGPPVLATVSYDPASFKATLTPQTALAYATTYEGRLTTAITDVQGNALVADHVWTFTTAPQDLTPPALLAAVPAPGATGLLASTLVTATFSEPIDPATVTAASFTLSLPGGPAIAAAVSYDAGTFTATLDPAVDLDYAATTYAVRLTTAITDLAGNPLPHAEAWTLTTRIEAPICALATSTADFAGGNLTGAMISEMDSSAAGGQLRLQAQMNDLYRESTLDPRWHITSPSGGYAPVITGGILDVQERNDDNYELSSMETYQTWGPSVVLEARAMFVPGSKFIDVGLNSNTFANDQYAWFSSAGTGDQPGQERIKARVREYDHTTNEIDTPATYNEWHLFKIIWTPGRVDFYVDGAHVAEFTNVRITQPLHAAFYKSSHSSTPYYIDWIRVTPYTATPGSYESPVVDTGRAGTTWSNLEWMGTKPSGTSVSFETRTGSTPAPDDTWSAWSHLAGDGVVSPAGRYGQYRAFLATDDLRASPVIDEVQFCYNDSTDVVAPTVVATVPANGAVSVPVNTTVSAAFSEEIDPTTETTARFTLSPQGGATVLATVSYDSVTSTATLTPSSPLDYSTVYEARLTTGITDRAGNSLAQDDVWTFTTESSSLTAVAAAPAATALLPNAPNPFNPLTTVAFDLVRQQAVRVRIYAVDGSLVRTLIASEMAAGRHFEVWDGRDDAGRAVGSGTYLLRLETSDFAQTRKMLMVR